MPLINVHWHLILFIYLKILRIIISVLLVLLIFGIIYANYNLYYQPSLISQNGVMLNYDLIKQLNYLENKLDNGVDHEMQKQYPEGFFFSNLMYGLTWCEFAVDLPEGSTLKNKAVEEAINSLDKLKQDYCRQSFNKNLPLQFGAFYFSWTNYLRAKILMLSNSFAGRDRIISEFNFNCDTLSKIIFTSESPFFESYPEQYWPADILPGIASLSLHNKLFGNKYDSTIAYWFDVVESIQNPGVIIFPHSVNNRGVALQSARGSSLGLILILLKEISEIDAGGIYSLYNRAYKTSFLGLPLIHEYSGNNYGEGDIDSGPVICGYGSVATIIGSGVFRRYGELGLTEQLNQTIEFLGFPYENSETKIYLAGQIPMADFFIAWVKSLKTLEYKTINHNTNQRWRLSAQIISYLIVSVLIVLIVALSRKKNIKK